MDTFNELHHYIIYVNIVNKVIHTLFTIFTLLSLYSLKLNTRGDKQNQNYISSNKMTSKYKSKFCTEQATKAQKRSRGIAVLFL